MPSRTMTLAIAVFWLAVIGLMFYRDRAREEDLPPAFQFTLSDEVGPPRDVQWYVFFKDKFQDKQVAICNTTLAREPRRFRLHGIYIFEDGEWNFGKITIRLIETSYHITLRGELVEVKGKVSKQIDGKSPWFYAEVLADYWDENHSKKPRSQALEKSIVARLPSLRTVFNPLLPKFTLPGLYEGKTWEVSVFDPLENASPGPEPRPGLLIASCRARVAKEDFTWRETVLPPFEKRNGMHGWSRKGKEGPEKKTPSFGETRVFACWRVDVKDAAGALRWRIWVRQDDDAILQQEVNYPEGTLRLIRKLDIKR